MKTIKKGKVIQLSKNFKSTEFDCHGKGCCDETLIDEELVNWLQKIRDHFGVSVNINSGFRCPIHNPKVGGSPSSHHMRGMAADIRVKGKTPREVAQYAEQIGVKRIGLYETDKDGYFVHIGSDTRKRFWYGQAGKNVETFQDTTKVPEGNSPLVSYVNISPNKNSPRNHKIDTITIHCVVGQLTAKEIVNIDKFRDPNGKSSCNYAVGTDGSIGLCVEEKDRAWTSSSRDNDHRAITIEVASDMTHPYAVNDKAMKSLIELVADICKRNGIKELKWKADKSLIGKVDKQNMTAHRWFANTACPGDYLYNKMGYIADKVNEKLGVKKPVITVSDNNSIKISGEENIKISGETKPVKPADKTLKVGSEVSLLPGATYASGAKIPDWVFKSKMYIREMRANDICVISTKKTGPITGVVALEDLTPYEANSPATNFVSYIVAITANTLNVRAGAGTNYKINTQVKKNQLYTIVNEKNGWGKLKSGAGWISLKYTKKVR